MLYGTLCSGHHIYIPPQHPFPLTAIYKSDQEKMILLQLLRMSFIFINTVFSPIELDPNKTFFTNRTRIFKKIKSGFSLFH